MSLKVKDINSITLDKCIYFANLGMDENPFNDVKDVVDKFNMDV